MKTILSICLFVLMFQNIAAQTQNHCQVFEDNGTEDVVGYFKDFKNAIQQNMPQLKHTRQWARKNNRPEVELATNRLEYWAKKFIQAIDANNGVNQQALCEKFEKEREYAGDFVKLTAFFIISNTLSANNIDYSKYK